MTANASLISFSRCSNFFSNRLHFRVVLQDCTAIANFVTSFRIEDLVGCMRRDTRLRLVCALVFAAGGFVLSSRAVVLDRVLFEGGS